jgi:hypothetical protein
MIAGIRKTFQGLKIGTNNVPVVLAAGDVAAAGSNQATGPTLPYPVNNVTAGDGTKVVVLPAIRKAGQVCYVYHSVATVGLPVYPASGAAINGGSSNAAVTIEGKTLAIFTATSATNWAAIYTANT